jgi:hypothetical protein
MSEGIFLRLDRAAPDKNSWPPHDEEPDDSCKNSLEQSTNG